MITAAQLTHIFLENQIDYFTGVPDSQLKEFCNHIMQTYELGRQHVIAVNEGNAVALAAGHYLATGHFGLVYMQNSGLGNAINPITSLTDSQVYGIPVAYLIGWRGMPGVKDEPQHKKQGQITLDLLKILEIPYFIIKKETTIEEIQKVFQQSFQPLLKSGKSIAFVVEKEAITNDINFAVRNDYSLTREEVIQMIAQVQDKKDITISTTGKASRELFEYRESKGDSHNRDFLTVGSMGHASMIALSISEQVDEKVWCIDGDGALLMHTGGAAVLGARKPENFCHILINNGVHESVGGLPTVSYQVDWQKAMSSFGYEKMYKAETKEQLSYALENIKNEKGCVFLEILTNSQSRKDLMRPNTTPEENKNSFMEFLRECKSNSKAHR